MTLGEDEILELIQKPYNTHVKEWRAEHKVLDLYMNGGDVSSELEKVKNYENKEQKELRDKIARSTKDLVAYLLNPINKVFSANGFKSEIKFKANSLTDKFDEHLQKLPSGHSLTKWMEVYWLEAYITDPNAIILIESQSGDNPKSYPTYKSINVIHDYRTADNNFEYIILLDKKVVIDKEETQIYRVIDVDFDSLYYVNNNKLYGYGEDYKIKNTLEEIPAVLVSDIIDKATGGKKSFINKIDEVLKEFMTDSSVHSVGKFLHGFPIFWAFAMKCVTCSGTGKVGNKTCPTCDGKRLKVSNDVSDGIRLPLPQSSDDPKIAPHIAGFIQPALETWQMQVDEMHRMKEDMFYALWGTSVVESKKEKTATEVFINKEPINDKLNSISDIGEQRQTQLAKWMAELMYTSDQVDSVKIWWGRRYMIETPDLIWERYLDAKNKSAPLTSLDYLYKQFLMAEYHNDEETLNVKLGHFQIEPMVHFSLSELKGIATDEQIQRKLLFSDWLTEDVDFTKEPKILKEEFNNYFKTKYKNETITESALQEQGRESN